LLGQCFDTISRNSINSRAKDYPNNKLRYPFLDKFKTRLVHVKGQAWSIHECTCDPGLVEDDEDEEVDGKTNDVSMCIYNKGIEKKMTYE
jgi:hypothetical protein